jgi:hypothetical protein
MSYYNNPQDCDGDAQHQPSNIVVQGLYYIVNANSQDADQHELLIPANPSTEDTFIPNLPVLLGSELDTIEEYYESSDSSSESSISFDFEPDLLSPLYEPRCVVFPV